VGILGKDMFDMDRMYTNTRVEFGAAGYWVEEKVYPLPYGFVLTEILNMDVTPFQEALDELESVISQSHTEAVLGTFFNALKWFGRLPLYRSSVFWANCRSPSVSTVNSTRTVPTPCICPKISSKSFRSVSAAV